MAKKKQDSFSILQIVLATIIIVSLVLISVATLTNAALALKSNSKGQSDVVRQKCLIGLENAAVEAGVCTMSDLAQFNSIIMIRETQGIKAAKDACFSRMSSPGCKGLCVAAVNCYDL
ncbi:hypothetical protein ACFL2U_03880 [Patescibacteria group bacterium]